MKKRYLLTHLAGKTKKVFFFYDSVENWLKEHICYSCQDDLKNGKYYCECDAFEKCKYNDPSECKESTFESVDSPFFTHCGAEWMCEDLWHTKSFPKLLKSKRFPSDRLSIFSHEPYNLKLWKKYELKSDTECYRKDNYTFYVKYREDCGEFD